MTQSSPGRAAPSPIRAVSAGRSSSRTKSRDATTNNSTVHKTKKQDTTPNSVEEGLTVQGVEFVPLMITHTMSKPSPSRKQQHHHHRISVGASPARSVTTSSYHEITTKGEVQHHRVTSGSANDFFATNNGTAIPAIATSSPARTHQRIPSGGSISIPTTSYNNYNNDMSGGRSHKRVPSSGSIPTLYSNGSNRSHHSGQSKSHHSGSKSHHSRAPSAGSVPAS
eukprot:scaffold1723_cov97-Skeletonema_marinoi.AAC.1